MALTPGPQEAEFNDWYDTKFKPAMERGPMDKYVARQAWFAAAKPLLERIAALTAQVEQPAQQPLTDEKCDAIYRALDTWARGFDEYEFGLPQVCGGGGEGGREVIRHALRNRSQE
jgi:hypothetical protein